MDVKNRKFIFALQWNAYSVGVGKLRKKTNFSEITRGLYATNVSLHDSRSKKDILYDHSPLLGKWKLFSGNRKNYLKKVIHKSRLSNA